MKNEYQDQWLENLTDLNMKREERKSVMVLLYSNWLKAYGPKVRICPHP